MVRDSTQPIGKSGTFFTVADATIEITGMMYEYLGDVTPMHSGTQGNRSDANILDILGGLKAVELSNDEDRTLEGEEEK